MRKDTFLSDYCEEVCPSVLFVVIILWVVEVDSVYVFYTLLELEMYSI